MAEITISLPDGSQRSLPAARPLRTTLAESIGSRLAKAAVAAVVNGEEWDLGRELPDGAVVAIITADSDEGRHVLRHSTAHVLAQAVTQLFPGAKYSIGPAMEDGFYYDFELPGRPHVHRGRPRRRIEARMREIIKADQPFVRDELPAAEALEVFADQPYKCEIIERVSSGAADSDDSSEPGSGEGSACTATRPSSSTSAAGRTCRAPASSATSS
jgi:threonyl-tRNA synthetase